MHKTARIAQELGYLILKDDDVPRGCLIGAGCDRVTYEVDGAEELVVKESRGTESFQSLRELLFFTFCPNEVRELLIPLVAVTESGALVQRRADPSGFSYDDVCDSQEWAEYYSDEDLEEEPHYADDPDLRDYQEWYERHVMPSYSSDCVLSDAHRDNVMRFEGRIVIVDYGLCCTTMTSAVELFISREIT